MTYDRRGEAKLPEGTPAKRGIPLDDSIPGYKSFAKPEEEEPHRQEADDESIFRVDYPADLAKNQNRRDVNDSNADKHDGIGQFGKGKSDRTKPKSPYDKTAYVVEASQLATAHRLVLPTDGTFRVATRVTQVEQGLNPEVVEKGNACSVTLARADIQNLSWQFSVNCGNGPKIVRMKARRPGRAVKLTLMDVEFTCSCPAWRWLGPEHHAKREEYLKGDPRGTASVPRIKDPEGINRVCKHVFAVIRTIRKWQIPNKGTK